MKNAWMILAVVAICIIILMQLCNKATTKDTVSKAQYDALATRVKDTSNYYRQLLGRRDEQSDSAARARAQIEQQLTQSNAKVEASKITINRLAAKIEAAGKAEPSDNWVKVSPDYKDGCDSLVGIVKERESEIAQRDTTVNQLHNLMLSEISMRDSTINVQNEFNRKILNQVGVCMMQLQTAVKQQPRNQVYAGIGIFGNQINPLAGGQVNVSLKTRGNQIYEITGATVGNTWYGGVGTKILITFNRH